MFNESKHWKPNNLTASGILPVGVAEISVQNRKNFLSGTIEVPPDLKLIYSDRLSKWFFYPIKQDASRGVEMRRCFAA